ncbi:hypothetical protein MMC13_000665 [Lambiella insularis]|nr:hypothetical protein [Lambiella insularis]
MVRLSIISAGVTDSCLDIHGSLQAERLGRHLSQNGAKITHIFSSDLRRAYKTAEAIVSWQATRHESLEQHLRVKRLPVLKEQDFGYYEGRPFYARPHGSAKSGKDNHRSQHLNDPDFKDVESKEAMTARMESFLTEHLMPVLAASDLGSGPVIAIVSHGIILSVLWRCLLKRFASHSVKLGPGLAIRGGGPTTLEHLGGWSNTGYLDLDIQAPVRAVEAKKLGGSSTTTKDLIIKQHPVAPGLALGGYTMTIKAVNSKDHLSGLKRTGGGVGSSKFDEGQKTIESFFKKRKV